MELFKLIKMLFGSKPSDYIEPVLMPMKHYPFKGYKFMMWCGRMIYRENNITDIEAYMNTSQWNESKRHESFHLKQAQTHAKNSWLRYYWNYFCEWIKGIPFIPPFKSAYYTIPFEVEAYALQGNEDSFLNYDETLLKSKYTLKKRKNIYKKHSSDWKEYVKTL